MSQPKYSVEIRCEGDRTGQYANGPDINAAIIAVQDWIVSEKETIPVEHAPDLAEIFVKHAISIRINLATATTNDLATSAMQLFSAWAHENRRRLAKAIKKLKTVMSRTSTCYSRDLTEH